MPANGHSDRSRRRNAETVFLDEPIQWHKRSTKFDRCPYCGWRPRYINQRRRFCDGPLCNETFTITLNQLGGWISKKLAGGAPTPYQRTVTVAAPRAGHQTLIDAQRGSRNRKAYIWVGLGVPDVQVFWTLGEYEPFVLTALDTQGRPSRYPGQAKLQRVVAAHAGSPAWRQLAVLTDWWPDQALSPLEQLADAAQEI